MWKPEHKVSHTFADFLLHVKPDVIVNGVFSMCRLGPRQLLVFFCSTAWLWQVAL